MFQLRLKELREREGLSQRQFGEKIEWKQSMIGNWEAGTREPNIEKLKKLADFFGVSVDYLVGASDNPQRLEKVGVMMEEVTFHERKLLQAYRLSGRERQEIARDVLKFDQISDKPEQTVQDRTGIAT